MADADRIRLIVQIWKPPAMSWRFSFVKICGNLSKNFLHACYAFHMDTSTVGGFSRVLDLFSRSALILALGILPIVIIPQAAIAIAQSKMLLLVVVLAAVALAWAIARLAEGAVRLPRGPLLYAGFALVIAYVVSAVFAGWPSSAIVGQGIEQDTLTAVMVFFASFALTALLFTGQQSGVRAALRTLAIGLTVLLAYQAAYLFFPGFNLGILSGNTANLLGSWHDLGILAGFTLFMSLALFRSDIFSGAWRFLLFALALLALFMLVVVHFADVLWATAALLLLGFLASARSSMQAEGLTLMRAATRAAILLVLAVVLALGAYMGPQLWDRLPAPILVTQVEVRPSWQGTFDVGRQSLGAPTSLLFGTGPNSFIREWGQHKPEGVNTTPFWNSDFNYGVGIIPTSVFTAGLLATLAWLALALIVLGLFVRFIREVRPLSTGRTLFGFLLAGVAYLIVFHMIYTPGVALTALTFMLLGFLAVVVSGDRPPRMLSTGSVAGATAFALAIFCAVPAVFASGLIGREVASNIYVNRAARAYNISGDIAKASANLQTSLAISSRNDRAHRAAAELGIVEFLKLAAQGEPATQEAREKLRATLEGAIQHGLTAISIDDANYQNWLVLAQVYGSFAGANVEGAYEQAKQNYERAFEANPTNPVPKLRLAQLAASQNDAAGTRAYLQEALALKPDFAAALYLLSQAEAAAGNGDAAVQAAAATVQLVPDDPIGWFNLGFILYSGGMYQDAAASLEQAVVRANDYSNALFFLGLSYYQMQRPQDAVIAFQRVLELNPDQAWLQAGIEDVQAGRQPFVENTATDEIAPEERELGE